MNPSGIRPSGNWIDTVLHFWFAELQPQAWFTADPKLDDVIRGRFRELYDQLGCEASEIFDSTAQGCLAAVIVFDQFPRNMFRGSPKAFATDALALSIAEHAIGAGLDQSLTVQQRQFLYMPFQHSEDRIVQARSMELFASLGDSEVLGYAQKHQEIVDRFGRFPHRNATLGRTATASEIEFLKTHPGF